MSWSPRGLEGRRARPLESTVQDGIRLALGMEPDLVLWRNAIAKTSTWDPATGRERWVHAGLPVGSADLIGVLTIELAGLRFGRFFALEVKRPGERARPEQIAWCALVRRMGGFACTVDSVEAARAALLRARAGGCE